MNSSSEAGTWTVAVWALDLIWVGTVVQEKSYKICTIRGVTRRVSATIDCPAEWSTRMAHVNADNIRADSVQLSEHRDTVVTGDGRADAVATDERVV